MIQDFISQVKTKGLARTNRYEVVIAFPNAVDQDTRSIANLFCDAVTLPGANIATQPMRIFGESREMPYEKSYDPVTMSFYVDSDMRIKKAFESWMGLIHNTNTRTLGYYENYIRPVEIYVNSVDGSTPYMLTLYEAYPKTLNSIQLDTAGREIMKMTVTMQYKYWRSKTVDILNAQEDIPSIDGDRLNISTNTGDPSETWWAQGSHPSATFDPPRSVFSGPDLGP